MLNKAIEIAVNAHKGQLDEAGEEYILHPLRVMSTRTDNIERICAVLHDVVEDTDITFEDLRKHGFSEEIITILDCLTKRKGEAYEDFIGRILENEKACRIKIADIWDNMDLSRLEEVTDEDLARNKKYSIALERISDVLVKEYTIESARTIEIDGCVEIPSCISEDEFYDKFIGFIEQYGWYFGGGINDITDQLDEL